MKSAPQKPEPIAAARAKKVDDAADRISYFDLSGANEALRPRLVEAFERVLAHGQFILGPEVATLERELVDRIGCHRVLGVSSGTAALRLALKLHGIGSGDDVLTVSHSFFATGGAVVLEGARPVFVDVLDSTMQVDPLDLERALTRDTKAVLVVHLNGQPCDVEAVADFCRRKNLELIEDCAQAIGTRSASGRHVGTTGVGCFSLHPLKVLSGIGDGGFITVASAEQAERLERLRNLGLVSRGVCGEVAPNERLDTLHAALLLVKLQDLDRRIERRRENAEIYRARLEEVTELRLPPRDVENEFSTYTAFVVRHPRRDELVEALQAAEVDAKIHYPLATHQQPGFDEWNNRPLPVSEQVVSQIISLPIRAGLDARTIERAASLVRAAATGLDD